MNAITQDMRDRSRTPHHHPNQHTQDEIKLIMDMRRRNPLACLNQSSPLFPKFFANSLISSSDNPSFLRCNYNCSTIYQFLIQ